MDSKYIKNAVNTGEKIANNNERETNEAVRLENENDATAQAAMEVEQTTKQIIKETVKAAEKAIEAAIRAAHTSVDPAGSAIATAAKKTAEHTAEAAEKIQEKTSEKFENSDFRQTSEHKRSWNTVYDQYARENEEELEI